MIMKILSTERYCRIYRLKGSSAILLLSEGIEHVYTENVAFTTQETIFNIIMFRGLENISLETPPRICLLVGS